MMVLMVLPVIPRSFDAFWKNLIIIDHKVTPKTSREEHSVEIYRESDLFQQNEYISH